MIKGHIRLRLTFASLLRPTWHIKRLKTIIGTKSPERLAVTLRLYPECPKLLCSVLHPKSDHWATKCLGGEAILSLTTI